MYKHDRGAILGCCPLAILCLSVFLTFYRRDLKPAVRHKAGPLHISRLVATKLYRSIARGAPLAPASAIPPSDKRPSKNPASQRGGIARSLCKCFTANILHL